MGVIIGGLNSIKSLLSYNVFSGVNCVAGRCKGVISRIPGRKVVFQLTDFIRPGQDYVGGIDVLSSKDEGPPEFRR
jgi:hypothetical protein